MNVLVLCDDTWHPGEVIERGLRPIANLGVALDFVRAPKDILTREMIREYDVVICARGNCHSAGNPSAPWFEPNITAVMPKDFIEYIEEGHGFIALHAGNTYTRADLPDMATLTGNDFITHPPQCTVEARPTGNHVISEELEPFSFRDEHYIINLHAKDASVFLTTASDTSAGTQPAGYTRLMSRGRFCCLTPGHNCSVLQHPSFVKLLHNALRWCAGEIG